MRVVFFITASVTVSSNPETLPLISNILTGGLVLFKAFVAFKVYKNVFVDVVDTLLYFSLLVLSGFSLYDFKANAIKQTAVAYTSTIITFILFIGSICYHVRLLTNMKKPQNELEEYLINLPPLPFPSSEVTHTVIDPPTRDQNSPISQNGNEGEILIKLLSTIN